MTIDLIWTQWTAIFGADFFIGIFATVVLVVLLYAFIQFLIQ
jgi:hypothetical protein